jgi:hypothetical protein
MSGLLTAIVVRMRRSVFVMFTGWAIAREDSSGDWSDRVARIDGATIWE